MTIDTIRCSDITETDTRSVTWWTSADRRRELDMTGSTAAEALAELMGQCTDDEQRTSILSGTMALAAAQQ
jgi:hypothetical protein